MEIRTRNAKLPWIILWQIRRSLKWLNEEHLVGISHIDLQEWLAPATQSSPKWHQQATEERWSVNAQYFAETSAEPACIVLYARTLYRTIPKVYWVTPVATLNIVRTLSHEVAHHLIAKRGYVFKESEQISSFEEEEQLADLYSVYVSSRMKGWCARLALWMTKDLADSYYQLGIFKWRERNYPEAAESWYRTFLLDPTRQDAVYWFHQAKEASAKSTDQSHLD
ncbi:MAG TPA: hypothetical protein VGQ39_26130 [Pyrinomonadaceae bacterium]|jgi:hypothetical protein|nr:hypothetical protein [Pyrinomonadaceae bacterium]